MEGELVEHIGVAPALQRRVLGRRQRMAQAFGQFLGRGRGAQRIQFAHGGVGQRVNACAARRVALGQSPGQEAAQGRIPVRWRRRCAEPPARRRPGPHSTARRRRSGGRGLERGVQAVVARRARVHSCAAAGMPGWRSRAAPVSAQRPSQRLPFLPGTGRRQVQRVTMGERHDRQAAWRAADASSWPGRRRWRNAIRRPRWLRTRAAGRARDHPPRWRRPAGPARARRGRPVRRAGGLREIRSQACGKGSTPSWARRIAAASGAG